MPDMIFYLNILILHCLVNTLLRFVSLFLLGQVLDEADTMFDKGFGIEVRKFLGPLRNRSRQPDGAPFQTVLVTATITKVFVNFVLKFYVSESIMLCVLGVYLT